MSTSQNTWNNNSTPKRLEEVSSKDKIKVVLSKKIVDKIKYLCKVSGKDEWSGILLYTVKGTIKNPSKMVLTVQEIIMMHKGNSTYTEYHYNEKKRDNSGYLDRHIDYTNDNPDALGWKIGQIHSHNFMKVYFSPTDMEELVENSDSHNYYLSLIVNNYNEMTAKVAFKATAETTVEIPYEAIDDVGETYVVSKSNFKVSKSVLVTHECDIQIPSEKLTLDEAFLKNVEDVLKISQPAAINPKQHTGKKNNKVTNTFKPSPQHAKVSSKTLLDVEKTDNPFDDEILKIPEQDELENIELFIMSLFLGGEIDSAYKDFEDVLMVLDETVAVDQESVAKLSDNIISNYPAIFNRTYHAFAEEEGAFEVITQEVIETLEEYEPHYKFLSKTIMALKYMLNLFEEYGKSTV